MRSPRVSAIMAIYNVENYLRHCVESLLAQTLESIEIILVDDGSTDSSGDICDEYAEKYPEKITVVHQENQKLSYARKKGLEYATGEYFAFVDSDDWVAPDMYRLMYDSAVANNSEIVFCDFLRFNEDSLEISERKVFSMEYPAVKDFFLENSPQSMWNKLFHNSTREHMHFVPNMTAGEDTAVIVALMTHVERISYVRKPLYYYRLNGSSSTFNFAKKNDTDDYIRAQKLALLNARPLYSHETIRYIVQLLDWALKDKRRKNCKADLIEYLLELAPKIIYNPYIVNDPRFSDIMKIIESRTHTIPKRVVIADFEGGGLTEAEKMCRKSWEYYCSGFEFIALNTENCDIFTAPKCVREAFGNGDYAFVGDYFKLKEIYENGGVALKKDILLMMPLGGLRLHKTFFGILNQYEVNSSFYGSRPYAAILKKLLLSYEEDSVFNIKLLPFGNRLRDFLVGQYGARLVPSFTQLLKENITLMQSDEISFDMCNGRCVAKIFTDMHFASETESLVLTDRSVVECWHKDRERFWREKTNLQKKLDMPKDVKPPPPHAYTPDPRVAAQEKEIGMLKKELTAAKQGHDRAQSDVLRIKNSKSWKITKPFRVLTNTFRKNKYSAEEVE